MILIKNARIVSMGEYDMDCGDILIDGKLIAEVGANLPAPEGAQIIDARGQWALPGFIDAHCHLGMWEDGLSSEGADGNEITDPVTPHLRAIDAINPMDRSFEEARNAGVTTVCTGPGSANVVGGQFAIIKTYGRRIDDMIVRAPAALKVAFGENPKVCYGKEKKMPSTRMATAALLRDTLTAAQEYLSKMKGDHNLPDHTLRMDVLVNVLEGELPIKAHAHRADDILTAIRIAKEFAISYTLEHCTEGHLIADILKAEGARVILGPLLCDRSKVELRNLSFDAPRILAEAGVEFAMMTDHPVIPLQYLPVQAAIAVREGLDPMAALRAITINPARILDIDTRVGSIEPRKEADIALFDGDPLAYQTRAQRVFIGGTEVYARS